MQRYLEVQTWSIPRSSEFQYRYAKLLDLYAKHPFGFDEDIKESARVASETSTLAAYRKLFACTHPHWLWSVGSLGAHAWSESCMRVPPP
jgi:hypothetical protein